MAASATTIVKGAEEQGNFFTRLAWYYQMLVLILLAALLFWGSDFMLYSDTRADTAKIKEQVETLKAKNAQGSIIRQNLVATQQALEQKRAEIEQLRDLLPDAVEISRVYDNIKDFLREQRLELRRFAHQKPISAEFYTAQPIQIEVTGSYDALGQFFSRLGFFTRIVSVTDVDIRQAEDTAQEAGRSINGSFVVTAFYLAPENIEKLTAKKPAAATPPPTPNPPNAQGK